MKTQEVCHAEITTQDPPKDRQRRSRTAGMVPEGHHHPAFKRTQHEQGHAEADSPSKRRGDIELLVPGLDE